MLDLAKSLDRGIRKQGSGMARVGCSAKGVVDEINKQIVFRFFILRDQANLQEDYGYAIDMIVAYE